MNRTRNGRDAFWEFSCQAIFDLKKSGLPDYHHRNSAYIFVKYILLTFVVAFSMKINGIINFQIWVDIGFGVGYFFAKVKNAEDNKMENQLLKDRVGRKIGEIKTNGNRQEIHDRVGRKLGYFDGRYTYDRVGRKIGEGNLLASLLDF